MAAVIVISNEFELALVPEPVKSVAAMLAVVVVVVPVTAGVPVITPALLMLNPAGRPESVNVNVSVSGSLKNPLTSSAIIATPSV